MKLAHLFSIRRLARCRRLFRCPFRTHLGIAAAPRRPIKLQLRDGGCIELPEARQYRAMFDWILHDSPAPWPVWFESGLVHFQHAGEHLMLRPAGEDFYIFREVFVEDVYGLARLPGNMDTVVDLGANVGLFTLRVAPLARRVIAVEPIEANFRLAQRNCRQSARAERIFLRRLAVAGKSGQVRLYLSKGNRGGHSLSPEHAARWQAAGWEDVPAVSLAELFEQEGIERCALLKCDVEGAEFEIFRSAPMGLLARIDRLLMEVHLTTGRWNTASARQLVARLQAAGLEVDCPPLQTCSQPPGASFLLRASRPEYAQQARRAG